MKPPEHFRNQCSGIRKNSDAFTLLVLGTILGVCPATLGQTAASRGPRTETIHRSAYQQLWHVSRTTGSDTRGHGSRELPWQTIGQALTQSSAASAHGRHAILVAGGAYAKQTISMKPYVDLFGGFEPATWERDIWKHPTILDGEGTRRILQGASHARLDGFVIQGGAARGPGAGLFCDHASPEVTNNRFFKNRTLQPIPWDPRKWHDTAHDGGAIYCTRGSQSVIKGNLFADNATEIGRGAAIALHDQCGGRIAHNVFYRNRSGGNDSMRSSDGGAVSVFDWSRPLIANNLFLHNRALRRNDGGGLFVALWSSPVIVRNLFVDNSSGDDACALFVGGQEHRYGEPQDPTPGEEQFFVRIADNLFVNNFNQKKKASSVRFTMEGRGLISNNLLARNARFVVENSAASVINNTVLGDTSFAEEPQSLKLLPSANNIFWGNLFTQSPIPMAHSITRDGYPGPGNLCQRPQFLDDQRELSVASAIYVAQRLVTRVNVTTSQLPAGSIADRVVRAGDRWGVIEANRGQQLAIWGDLSGASSLEILPSYRPCLESPGIDSGTLRGAPARDRHGNQRPFGKGIDIGADEFTPSQP